MGVTGLWKLIESSGKPIPLESLENKVLAVDISIWLHQVVKGYQDAKGRQLQNAHLIGLFNRICKLLYFRIKPIFIFDGGVCELKRQTLAKRAQSKSKIKSDAERIEALLLENLAKEQLIKQALGDEAKAITLSPSKSKDKGAKKEEADDMFKLPEIKEEVLLKTSLESEICPKKSYNVNINKIDVNSSYFKSLPADIRHDILTDIKETRKQNSWAKLRELPPESQDFSSYQMKGLLKRRQVQVSLESAEKEMGGKVWSLSELESLLTEDGVLEESKHAQRIANDPSTRFILVRDIAKAMNEAKEAEKYEQAKPSTSKQAEIDDENFGEEDIDLELQRAIQMSLEEETGESEVKEEKFKDEPIKLNAEQRKKLGGSVHGLVRGFMMEYAEMNDDDLKDMLEASQAPHDTSKEEDELQAKFPNTDHYVLYGTQKPQKEVIEIQSDDEHPEIPEKKAELVITVDSSDYRKEEDIFADIFEAKSERATTPDVEVASISSSDDDTVDYEVPQLESSQQEEDEVGTKATKEMSNESKDASTSEETPKILSENEKFWSDEVVIESKEVKSTVLDSDEIKLSENEKFWSEEIEVKTKEVKASIVLDSDEKLSENEKFWSDEKEVDDTTKLDQSNEIKSEAISVIDGEIKVTLSPQKTLVTKEEVNKAVEDLKKVKTQVELEHMQEELQNQQQSYELERNKLNRQGTSITQQMTNDCKQLLKLFGLPFIQAPMEAEAQCAFLNSIKITDGTISDDSDIWLFGAQNVYKNFFVQKKMVMEFKMENLEKMLHLDRNKLIQLAMLVGSDYTVGINGIGAVTALEILSAFPPTPEEKGATDRYQSMLSSLRKFREWFTNGKQDGSKGKATLKSKLKNIEIFDGFPSVNVLRAYLEPIINDSTDPFSWGEIDVESVFELTRSKLGWTRSKTEEILNPVLKKLNDKKQSTIKDYFQVQMKKVTFDEQKLSTRVQKAVKRMAGEEDEEEPPKKRAPKKKNKKETSNVVTLSEDDDELPAENKPKVKKESAAKKKAPKQKNEPSTSKAADDDSVKNKQVKKESPIKKKAPKRKNGPSTSKAAKVDDEPIVKKAPRIPETKQIIPQRENDKKKAEENKKKAIDIFRLAKKSSK